MPFYKMLCIAAHYKEFKQIKELVTESAMLLLDRGAAVRAINSLGTRTLPQRMHRDQYYEMGDYWMMYFDASPRTLHELNKKMRRDPRVIRWTVLKIGERLQDVVEPKEMTTTEQPLVVSSVQDRWDGQEVTKNWSDKEIQIESGQRYVEDDSEYPAFDG